MRPKAASAGKEEIASPLQASALAIVESRGMTVKDVTRATVYLKEPSYRAAWYAWLKANGLPADFATVIDADVCRPDWLFEVELDALAQARRIQGEIGEVR